MKVKIERVTEPFKERWDTAGKVLIVVAGVLVAAGVGLLAVSTSKQSTKDNTQSPQTNVTPSAAATPTIKFSNPRGTDQNPVMVSCQEDIEITGRMPKGYAFTVGVIGQNQNTDIEFVPETETATTSIPPDTWKVPLVFGGAANNGDKFTVYLEVLPIQQLNYLVAEAQSIRAFLSGTKYAGQSWWTTPGLPPAPAIAQDQETVQRTPDQTGCPPR